MKPGVKKWLKVVGVVYAVVVIAMVAAMWTKAKPADPKGLAQAVRQSLEQALFFRSDRIGVLSARRSRTSHVQARGTP